MYEDIIGGVLGLFGGGTTLINVPTRWDVIAKILLFIVTSFCAAFIGVAGKRCCDWCIAKLFKK